MNILEYNTVILIEINMLNKMISSNSNCNSNSYVYVNLNV